MGFADEIRKTLTRVRQKAWPFGFGSPQHGRAAGQAVGETVTHITRGNVFTPNPYFDFFDSATNIPDFYEIEARNAVTVNILTTTFFGSMKFGDNNIRVLCDTTDSNLELQSTPFYISDASFPLEVRTLVKANTTVGPFWAIRAETFDREKVSLGTSIIASGSFSGTTPEHKRAVYEPGATAFYVKFSIDVGNTSGAIGNLVDIGYFSVRRRPLAFHAFSTAAQTIETGAGEQLGFTTEEFDNGSNFTTSADVNSIRAGESEFLAPYPLLMSFGAAGALTANSSTIQLELCINMIPVKFLVKENITGDNPSANGSVPMELDQDDTVQIRISHGSGASKTTDAGQNTIFFWGTEIAGYA